MKTTVILPLSNCKTTIGIVLKSFTAQPKLYQKLVIIDDGSTDGSVLIAKKFLSQKNIPFRIISHVKSRGLAASYNEAIKSCKSELILTLHADVVLKPGALKNIIDPFLRPDSNSVVGTYHIVSHPYWVWKKYNFWQKCYFARFVGKSYFVAGGKFNCYRRAALVKVGLYDEENYRTAGEDSDMIYKLKKIGKLVETKAQIIHVHKIDPNFSWRDIIYKHAQYAEAQGALLRNGRIAAKDFAAVFYREIIVLGLFIPYLSFISLVLIVVHTYLYTNLAYKKEFKDPRILFLPVLNTILLFISFIFSVEGFFTGKQKI